MIFSIPNIKPVKADTYVTASIGAGDIGSYGTGVDKLPKPVTATAAKKYSWESLLQTVQNAPAGLSTTQIIVIVAIVAAAGLAWWLFNKK